ncbi:MAG: peptidoglycan DD-metalloendopeptidase family protein [Gammaproteobacteria bacterium]|nr:peptidoglycan DD-metalloendopeptidase family protein [Gammaproteobacteria bacterium]
MKIFTRGYVRAMEWVQKPSAPIYLGGLSFLEAVVCPIPVETLLVPMTLSKPRRALFYTLLATITSVLGGSVGYLLGRWAFDPLVLPVLEWTGSMGTFQVASGWFMRWGVWIIFIAGFSPIPFKVFTVAAGVFTMPWLPFLCAAFISRGLRFALVSQLIVLGGERMERFIRRYVERIGWLTVGVILLLVFASCSMHSPAPLTDQTRRIESKTSAGKAASPKREKNIAIVQQKTILPKAITTKNIQQTEAREASRWIWPVIGKVVQAFSEGKGQKGIHIRGAENQPIHAAADGKVVYSGGGLKGYGNLIIIKHDEDHLTAYAHNRSLLVKEGDVVKQGSEIAKMGRDSGQPAYLYFELRHKGRPKNPLEYLVIR